MKSIFVLLGAALGLMLLLIACENREDPFSALNNAPRIQVFSFDEDSLKFTRQPPFDISYLNLRYEDTENQNLTATFNFLSGGGKILHGLFREVSRTSSSVTFEVPGDFNSDQAGRPVFIPDTTGLVEIKLVLSDKVKSSDQTTTALFFKNLAPLANFTVRSLSNASPYALSVDGSSSRDRDAGRIKFYYWRFGDGTPTQKSGSSVFQHMYQRAGTYTVQLKVEDDEGGLDSTEQVITTNNQSPLAALQVTPVSGQAPLTIQYAATNSVDPDGRIVSYRVDFDDGSSSLDSVGTHTYTTDERYRVRLQVQDNLGQSDTTAVEVNVATPPVAVLSVDPTEGAFPLDVFIDARQSRDPQGGEVEHDIFIDNELVYDNVSNVTHTFTREGTFLVRLVVRNRRNNLTAEANQFVNVTSEEPLAVLSVSPTDGPFPLDCFIDASQSQDPQGGDLDFDIYIGGELTYENVETVTHTFAEPGTFRIRLVVTSKLTGLSAEKIQFVTARNLNPTAKFVWSPQAPQNRTPVTYTSNSSDPNPTDQITNFKWTFPFGEIIEGPDKAVVIHSYDAGVDTFKVKLEIWDKFDGYDTITNIIPRSSGKK